jgi:glutamate dehydrogenase
VTDNKKNKPANIDSILRFASRATHAHKAEDLPLFLKHYYANVSPDDLAAMTAELAYAAAWAHRQFAEQRPAQQALVRVYNPTADTDGWKTQYTVVEIVTDDMPFLVDSVRMEINRQGYIVNLLVHPIFAVQRNSRGAARAFALPSATEALESFIHVELDRMLAAEQLADLQAGLQRVLQDVRCAVQDWSKMLARLQQTIELLSNRNLPVPAADCNEAQAFLQWLADRNFTFLGFQEYRAGMQNGVVCMQSVAGTALGLMQTDTDKVEPLLPAEQGPELLLITKSVRRSTVHHPGYIDHIAIRLFDAQGNVTGEHRFLGLYTSIAFRRHPAEVPVIGRKIERVFARSKLNPISHNGKSLQHILETYPREELFQISEKDLYAIAHGILRLGERQQLKVFVREDSLRRFIFCLVYVPRDRFDTGLRLKISQALLECFNGTDLTFNVKLGDESFARVEYFILIDPNNPVDHDVEKIEQHLREISYAWPDRFRNALTDKLPEEDRPHYISRYAQAFPGSYREDFDIATAVDDAVLLDNLSAQHELSVNLHMPDAAQPAELHLKLYRYGRSIAPSDSLPILENMGVRVIEERPYRITPAQQTECWIHEYRLQHSAGTAAEGLKPIFEDVFARAWRGDLESDGFNALALMAGVSGNGITVLRAYCKYLLQAGLPFSQVYMERCVRKHPGIVRTLLQLFSVRFDPVIAAADRERDSAALQAQTEQLLDAVSSLDDDRILRNFLGLMLATVRTNFFHSDQQAIACVAFKFDTAKVLELPAPRPMFEIFVYSPRTEGVHLRTGKIARGGLRWSDRREDFRTEVLGLVKAQRVKNAVIVPTGAKGGFVIKRPPAEGGRDALLREVVECYRLFVGSLLEITDNIVGGKIVPPERVVRHDQDDPYLVVAADKGTATFSDYANELALRYQFWLGDAFASGGSQGYDHKKMGITARGAWESVKLHFLDMGKDVQSEPFTVAGIGDMAGDVFGNGLLQSKQIKLIAAFNHMHIFIDPQPEPAQSFAERQRLFNLPRSSWEDYNPALISAGGGVYLRSAKSITLSDEAQAALGTTRKKFTPNELIHAVLQAPVELIWNGGIGTYVKASTEQHTDAGDRSNDALRVNGDELRCKMFAEGGNLGMTQRARIEYALRGGHADTDFIHNAGGVDCSDHEVNIKILLNLVQQAGQLSDKQRSQLLVAMTDEVAELVLQSNYWQTLAITLIEFEAAALLDEHVRYIRQLEEGGQLDRKLEALPDERQLAERKTAECGLTRPEIAVLLSYSKIQVKAELTAAELWQDPYFAAELLRYFPTALRKQYAARIQQHPLRAEILATFIANRMLNRMGCTFVFRLQQETGATIADIARAYTIAWEVFGLRTIWAEISALSSKVPSTVRIGMMLEAVKLINRASKWLIQHRRGALGIQDTVANYYKGAQALAERLPVMMAQSQDPFIAGSITGYLEHGIAKSLALQVVAMDALYCTFDIVDISGQIRWPIAAVMDTYFPMSAYLDIFWLRVKMRDYRVNSQWEDLTRKALIDDLYRVLRDLTVEVLRVSKPADAVEQRIAVWHGLNRAAVDRTRKLLLDLKSAERLDLAMFSVSLRELQNLQQACAAANQAG